MGSARARRATHAGALPAGASEGGNGMVDHSRLTSCMGMSQATAMMAPSRKSAGKARQRSKAGSATSARTGRTFERLAPLHRRAKRECRAIERAQDDVRVRAAHLEPDATGSEIDRRRGRRFRPVGAPDAVDRPARRDEAEGGMKLQCQSRRVLRRDIGEASPRWARHRAALAASFISHSSRATSAQIERARDTARSPAKKSGKRPPYSASTAHSGG